MRRILVVDDDLHTRLAIGIWLKQCGFRVAITDGGESGLAALNDGTFDLMIVDVFMPNMRGFESIRVFHDHAPSGRTAENFQGERQYGLNCRGKADGLSRPSSA